MREGFLSIWTDRVPKVTGSLVLSKNEEIRGT